MEMGLGLSLLARDLTNYARTDLCRRAATTACSIFHGDNVDLMVGNESYGVLEQGRKMVRL